MDCFVASDDEESFDVAVNAYGEVRTGGDES